MRLLGNLIIRIAVRVNRLIKLLIRHERMHKLIVGVQQATEPLLMLYIVNLFTASVLPTAFLFVP